MNSASPYEQAVAVAVTGGTMGKGKKVKPRVDNSARIARGAAKKAAHRDANAMAHLRNEELAERMGITPGKGKDRPSVQIRRAWRAANKAAAETA